MTNRQILAIYLVTIALLQIGLYFAFFQPRGMGGAFYFDPRIGIDFWFTGRRMTPEDRLSAEGLAQLIRWSTGAWVLILGLLFMAHKAVTKLYVISECLLSLPSLLFFLMVIVEGISSGHGFLIGELLIPMIVFGIYTAVPLSIGLQDWRTSQ